MNHLREAALTCNFRILIIDKICNVLHICIFYLSGFLKSTKGYFFHRCRIKILHLPVRPIRGKAGFTLLEVMISLAVIGGLLVTLLYTLNHHLGIAERHGVITLSMGLAKEKLYEMERKPEEGKGTFPDPYAAFSFETSMKDASFPGFLEISVSVRNRNETVTLSELIRKQQ